eukprot:2231442-Prymnesium_polylepis.1
MRRLASSSSRWTSGRRMTQAYGTTRATRARSSRSSTRGGGRCSSRTPRASTWRAVGSRHGLRR